MSLHFLSNGKKKGKKEKEKVFISCFIFIQKLHMNCHTLEFQPQTQNLELRFTQHHNKLLTAKL